jgi:transposase
VLVDLERRRMVDLLPDRTAETLAAWLRAHAGVEIITRDRSSTYAEGALTGAPEAIQVADRFHLLRNLGEAVGRSVTRHHQVVREVVRALGAPEPLSLDGVRRRRVSGLPNNAGGPTQAERRQADRRARRFARYQGNWSP